MTASAPWVIFIAFLLAAGCVGSSPGAGDEADNQPAGDEDRKPIPAAIEDTKTVTGGGDPGSAVTGETCSNAASTCERYPFTLEGDASFEAKLTWTQPVSDFDLYLLREGETEPVTLSAGPPPSTEEAFQTKLRAGTYELVVVAWAVAQDTYTVQGTFSHL